MLFYLWNYRKTVKTLRRRAKYTARELGIRLKKDTAFVLRMEEKRLCDIETSLRRTLIQVFRNR